MGIELRVKVKQGDIMKIAELVEALESVRAITGECTVLVENSAGEVDSIKEITVTGSPGALECCIKVIPHVK